MGSVVVLEEHDAIVLTQSGETIGVAPGAAGKELMLLVGTVPETHLDSKQMVDALFGISGLVAGKAVLGIERKGDALVLRLTCTMTLPCIAETIAILIDGLFAIFAINGLQVG